jgi:hypothetical protein
MTAVTAHANSSIPGVSTWRAISAETINIPEPIIEPMMMAVESKSDKLFFSVVMGGG